MKAATAVAGTATGLASLPHDATGLLEVVVSLGELLGYRTDLDRLPAALADAAPRVAAWLAAGARYATASTLIAVGALAAGDKPDLLHAAGLVSIPGAGDRYAASAASRFAAACDALSGIRLVVYEAPARPAAEPGRARRR